MSTATESTRTAPRPTDDAAPFDASLARLFNEVRPDPELGARVLKFHIGEAVVTLRIKLGDEQSGADLVITSMTVLHRADAAADVTRRGYGAKVLGLLLAWARDNELGHIEAVQVQKAAEPFWFKNGFVPLFNQCNDFRYQP